MLSIFALPKAFKGHIGVIQSNAIQSWLQFRPSCEIILFGDDKGTADFAAKVGIKHVPDVERNEYGTPLVSSLFSTAQKIARHEIIGYVNADIILLSDFLEAVRQVREQQFVLIGRRWDLDVEEPLDFSNPHWEQQLRTYLAKEGKLHRRSGLDYFVFPLGRYHEIPPFAIGRTAWDNWLIYKARSLGLPVIEATKIITAIHQNHDYARFPTGDKNHTEGRRKGVESQHNQELLGGWYYSYNLWDVTHILTPDGLKPAKSVRHFLWRLFRLPEMHPHLTPFVEIVKCLRSIAYRTVVLRRLYGILLR